MLAVALVFAVFGAVGVLYGMVGRIFHRNRHIGIARIMMRHLALALVIGTSTAMRAGVLSGGEYGTEASEFLTSDLSGIALEIVAWGAPPFFWLVAAIAYHHTPKARLASQRSSSPRVDPPAPGVPLRQPGERHNVWAANPGTSPTARSMQSPLPPPNGPSRQRPTVG